MPVDVGTIQAVMSLRDEMSGKLDAILGKMGQVGAAFTDGGKAIALAVTAGTAAVTGLAAAIVELGERGSEINEISASFDRFAGGAEVADAILAKLREGVAGTISDFDLMRDANKLVTSGFDLTTQSAQTLSEGARVLAHQFGTSTTEAIDQLTVAMETGRARGEMLKSLHVDMARVEETYAAKIGLVPSELNKQQKAEADSGAIMAALTARIAEAGAQSVTFAERIQQAKVAIENWVDTLSSMVARSADVQNALDVIGTALADAFGDGTTETDVAMKAINGFANAVADAVPYVVGFGKAVSDAIGWLKSNWTTIKDVAEAIGAMLVVWTALTAAVAAGPALLAAYNAAWTYLTATFGAATVAEGAAASGLTAMLGPIGLVTGAVGLMVLAFQKAQENTGWVRSLSDNVEYLRLRIGGMSAAQAEEQIATEHAMQAMNELGAATKNAGYIQGVTADQMANLKDTTEKATRATDDYGVSQQKLAADLRKEAEAAYAQATASISASEVGFQKALDLAEAEYQEKKRIAETEFADDATRKADALKALADYNTKRADITQQMADYLTQIQEKAAKDIAAAENAGRQQTLAGAIALLDAEEAAEQTSAQKKIGTLAEMYTAMAAIDKDYEARRASMQAAERLKANDALAALDSANQQAEIAMYESGIQQQLDLEEVKRQAEERTLNLRLAAIATEVAAGKAGAQQEYDEVSAQLAAIDAKYRLSAQQIVLNNDPIYRAWQGLNQNMLQTWADTWDRALSTGKGFVDAILSPFKQIEEAWLKVLAAMVAEWEANFIQKISGMNLSGAIGGQGGGGFNLAGMFGGLFGGGKGGGVPALGNIGGASLSADMSGAVSSGGMFGGMSGILGMGLSGAVSMGIGLAMPLITSAVGKFGGWLGGLFGHESAADRKGDQQLKDLTDQLDRTYGSLEAIRGTAGATGDALYAALQEKGAKGAKDANDALVNFNKVVQDQQAAVQKYGLTWKDADPSHLLQMSTKAGGDLMTALGNLKNAGYDYDASIQAMSGDFSAFAAQAVQAGTDVPDAMQPILQQLSDLGLLVDQNGNKFRLLGNTVVSSMDPGKKKLDETAASVQKLVDQFSGKDVFDQANIMVQAFQAVGGAANLTKDETRQVHDAVEAAIEKYQAMGQEVPAIMLQIAQATDTAAQAMGHYMDAQTQALRSANIDPNDPGSMADFLSGKLKDAWGNTIGKQQIEDFLKGNPGDWKRAASALSNVTDPNLFNYATGGVVYAAAGWPWSMFAKGTDTVPAMLTPGEGVLSTRGMRALDRLNAGGSIGSDEDVVSLLSEMVRLLRDFPRAVGKSAQMAAVYSS